MPIASPIQKPTTAATGAPRGPVPVASSAATYSAPVASEPTTTTPAKRRMSRRVSSRGLVA